MISVSWIQGCSAFGQEGNLESIYERLLSLKTRRPREASLAEVMQIAGILIFFLMACFDKVARGGLRPFFDWISEHADASSLWRTKHRNVQITARLMVGVDFFLTAIPQI